MVFRKYSADLKLAATKMALQNHSVARINDTLHHTISPRSIARWKELYETTNNVVRDPANYEIRGRPHLLSDEQLVVLRDIVLQNPDMYLDEVQAQLHLVTGVKVSKTTLGQELHQRLGLSLLVTRGVHHKQSIRDRANFIRNVAGIPPECFVFIDESGVVGRDAMRPRSWAPRGTRTVRTKRYGDADHWTILPAVGEQGMIAGVVVKGSVERIHVEMFLKRHLLPVMNAYPAPNSVLVLDNARIHHGGEIEEICRDKGILLVYLPAYSPDLNPIEKAFAAMKRRLQREKIWHLVDDKATYLLRLAGRVMTRKLLQPLMVNSGYTTEYYWAQYNERFDDHE